ncbi:MAG: hypothetical protein IIB89_03065 [Chloroflexi bacterium]|nr:hypothetical protein [Chloroflexota bacterium]
MAAGLVLVQQYQKLIVQKFGTYVGTRRSGLHFLIPFVYHGTKVDLRERVRQVPTQKYITADNVVVDMDFVIYYRVVEEKAERAVLEVQNFELAVVNLAFATLRAVIGSTTLSEALTERERIRDDVQVRMDEVTGRWGVKVSQVEINEILNDKLKLFWGSKYSDGFFGWSIPLDDGRTRVGVMTEGNSKEGINNLLCELNYDLEKNNRCINYKQRGISFGSISKSYSKRAIAIGESAGLVKTTTGGGIFYGILSAEIASDVIDKCFSTNDFSDNTLYEYESGWKKVIGNEIKYGQYLHNFFSKLSDDSIDELFEAVGKDGILDYISRRGNFDWHSSAVVKILRSPNIRRVLLNGFMSTKLRLAI